MTRSSFFAVAAAMALASTLVQAQQPRMRDAVTGPQIITIEASWGYPCLSDHIDCFPDATVDWVALEVAAWRGGQKFLGSFTNADGSRYAFEVPVQVAPAQRGDLVLLEVTAQSPDGHTARFTHLLDVAHRLQAEADGSGRVARSDARPRMLSIMTTALVGLLEEANGGDWRMDEARLDELLSQVDAARVMRHALAFQALVSGTLPGAGTVDPNALVASTEAVEAYLDGVPQTTLNQVFQQFETRGRSAYQPIDFSALDLTLGPASAPGTIAFGRREGFRMRMNDEWEEDFGGSTLMDTGLTRGLMTFFMVHNDSFPRAARVVRPGNPSFETQAFIHDCDGEDLPSVRFTARSPSTFRRMAVTAGFEFVQFSEQHQMAYAPLEGDDVTCLATLSGSEYVYAFRRAHALQGRGRSHVSLFGGPVALQVLNPDPDILEEGSQFIAGTVDLATGAVDAPGYAGSGVVATGPGGLVTLTVDALPGTLREGVVQMRMEGLRSDGLGAQEWVVSSRVTASADDHARAHVTPAVRVDAGFALSAGLLAGAWRSGSDLSLPGATQALTMDFNEVTGQGTQQAPGGDTVPFSWLILDGRMQASTFALDAQPDELLPACPPGAPDCREVLRSVWIPLRLGTREGLQRLYLIEERYRDEGAGLQRVSRQLNFYDAS